MSLEEIHGRQVRAQDHQLRTNEDVPRPSTQLQTPGEAFRIQGKDQVNLGFALGSSEVGVPQV